MVKNVKSGHTVLLEAYNLYFKYLMANTRPESTSSKIAFARVFDNFPTTLEQEGSVPILGGIHVFTCQVLGGKTWRVDTFVVMWPCPDTQ